MGGSRQSVSSRKSERVDRPQCSAVEWRRVVCQLCKALPISQLFSFFRFTIKMASRVEKSRKVDDDLANVEFETSEDVEVIPTFDSMGLREDLLRFENFVLNERFTLENATYFRGIYAYGFEKPSAIQQRAIKPIVKGRDVIAQAQSGTGKTATFSCAILQSIDTTVRETQVRSGKSLVNKLNIL